MKEVEDTRYKDIFLHLKNKGYAVYTPGQKRGECETKYVVVKDSGSAGVAGISSSGDLYDILLYVPRDYFSQMEKFKEDVKKDMDGLFPMIRPTHFETPSYLDETVQAHMVSVQYINYKKNRRS